MKLIVQPDTGLAPTLRAIKKARRSLDVLIFRLDREDGEKLENRDAAWKEKLSNALAEFQKDGKVGRSRQEQ